MGQLRALDRLVALRLLREALETVEGKAAREDGRVKRES